jgi:hypothetical protein
MECMFSIVNGPNIEGVPNMSEFFKDTLIYGLTTLFMYIYIYILAEGGRFFLAP